MQPKPNESPFSMEAQSPPPGSFSQVPADGVAKALRQKAEGADSQKLSTMLRRNVQQETLSIEAQQALSDGVALPKATSTYLTREQIAWGMDEFFLRITRMHKRKNGDYASTDDGLQNFRQTSNRLNVPMPQVFMVLLEKHFQALENDSQRPNLELNESLEDRLLDIAAYCGLFYLALKEKTVLKRKEIF